METVENKVLNREAVHLIRNKSTRMLPLSVVMLSKSQHLPFEDERNPWSEFRSAFINIEKRGQPHSAVILEDEYEKIKKWLTEPDFQTLEPIENIIAKFVTKRLEYTDPKTKEYTIELATMERHAAEEEIRRLGG